MNQDIVNTLLPWLTLLNLGVNGLLGVTVWLRKPGEDAGKAVSALAEQIAARMDRQQEARDAEHSRLWEGMTTLDLRLKEVETHLEHMPSSTELAELRGTVLAINERTQAQTLVLQRIEKYLYEHKL